MIDELAGMSGAGVVAARRALLVDVLGRATEDEQRLLWSVLGGELRHGALDGVMVDAIARRPPCRRWRCAERTCCPATSASRPQAALSGGESALAAVTMTPGRAVQPMLASPATDVAAALTATGEASVEWKLDGARIQAHRHDGDVRLFTRNLNDITAAPGRRRRGGPGAARRRLGARRRGARGGRRRPPPPLPGHDGRLRGRPADGARCGLSRLLLRRAARRRAASSTSRWPCAGELLATVVPASARLPSLVTADVDEAEAFLDRAVASGHEGVMVKALDSPTTPAGAAGAWRKVKPVHTLDLVVLAAEWGHGRRTGWLSNLHLGARGDAGELVMVGKTFKGLTDELLTLADRGAAGDRRRHRVGLRRARAAGAGRRDRSRRRAGVDALSGRRGAALRSRPRATARTSQPPTPTTSPPSKPSSADA